MTAATLRGLLNNIMYKDTAKIYRQVRVTEGYVDDFAWELTAADIPCHLAQYGKQLYAHRDDISQKLTSDLRLDCDPDVDIRTNDHIVVNHHGQSWELVAGEPFKYLSHQEISCRRRKEAGQT